MKIDHAIVYFDRKALYEKSKELRAELDVAERENLALSEWYFCLGEEEYAANKKNDIEAWLEKNSESLIDDAASILCSDLDDLGADYDSECDFGVCKFKVVGKAKAKDEDEFDEEFGRLLAKTRAQENAFRVANALYCEIGNVLNSLVFNDFCTLTEGTEQAFLKCINHENDLICEKFHLNS